MPLAGRRLLITGAARGLGESFARAALSQGARVVISDILDERGAALAASLGADCHYLRMDMSDGGSVRQGTANAIAWLGGLDGLVNNAAVTNSGGKGFRDITDDTWDQVMMVNVRGAWQACQASYEALRASGSGRIVNIASDTALWGAPRLMAYVASKGALISMTRSLARELGPDQITVNAIAPGLTLGESTEYVPQERHQYYQQGRAISRPQVAQDLDEAVLFLLSPASGYITGQVLPVNGGFVMP